MTADEAYILINNYATSTNCTATNWADLGCGHGLFTFALSRMLAGGSIIYGIDHHSALTHQITSNNVQIIPMKNDFIKDALRLAHLDGILMANSLHYVRDKPALIRKMQAYLKVNAHLLVVEYDTDIPVTKWVPYPVSFLSLTNLFESEGYINVQKISERPSVFGTRTMYSALISK